MPAKTSRTLKALLETDPWDWPDDAADLLVATLRDAKASPADKETAAELASELTLVNPDGVVEQLLATLTSAGETGAVRGAAAIAFGPVLDLCDTEGFEGDFADPPLTRPVFEKVHSALRTVHADEAAPKLVRRRALEAAVRAPQDWHRDAVRAAYLSQDSEWKLTAVFCMQFIRGFDASILEALGSADEEVRGHAVTAAGNWKVEGAWSHVSALLHAANTSKDLLLAAIEAVGNLRPEKAADELEHLEDSDDEDIAAAVEEALTLAKLELDLDGDDDEAGTPESR
jgi:hypothetical protein